MQPWHGLPLLCGYIEHLVVIYLCIALRFFFALDFGKLVQNNLNFVSFVRLVCPHCCPQQVIVADRCPCITTFVQPSMTLCSDATMVHRTSAASGGSKLTLLCKHFS